MSCTCPAPADHELCLEPIRAAKLSKWECLEIDAILTVAG